MKDEKKRDLERKLATFIHDVIDEFCEDYGLVIKKVSMNIEIDEDDTNSKYEMTTDMRLR